MHRWKNYLSALGLAGLLTASASAQGLGRPPVHSSSSQPPVNPILGMYRGNPAINYFTQVRPQMQTQQALQALQGQIGDLQFQNPVTPPTVADQNLPSTGHPVSFLNYSHYYPAPGQTMTGLGGGFSVTNGVRVNNTPLPSGSPRR